jgi:hypothetical protein
MQMTNFHDLVPAMTVAMMTNGHRTKEIARSRGLPQSVNFQPT